jgi:hypothetical protein
VTAESIPALFVDCVHFVENADAMYAASLLGEVRTLSAEDVRIIQADLNRPKHIAKLWRYYVGRSKSRGILPASWDL